MLVLYWMRQQNTTHHIRTRNDCLITDQRCWREAQCSVIALNLRSFFSVVSEKNTCSYLHTGRAQTAPTNNPSHQSEHCFNTLVGCWKYLYDDSIILLILTNNENSRFFCAYKFLGTSWLFSRLSFYITRASCTRVLFVLALFWAVPHCAYCWQCVPLLLASDGGWPTATPICCSYRTVCGWQGSLISCRYSCPCWCFHINQSLNFRPFRRTVVVIF